MNGTKALKLAGRGSVKRKPKKSLLDVMFILKTSNISITFYHKIRFCDFLHMKHSMVFYVPGICHPERH